MLLLLKNVVFTLLVPGTVAGYVPWLIVRAQSVDSWLQVGASSMLFAGGGAMYAWCVWDFASFGRGTPAPIDAPKRLVVRGLYRRTRNPMYLAVLTVVAGWVVRCPTLALGLYALCVGSAFQLFVVFYEEPHLRRLFGEQYEQYCARVGRWIFS